MDFMVRPGLFEQRIILQLVYWCGIVEDDDPHGVAVPPEVLVVMLDGLTDVA